MNGLQGSGARSQRTPSSRIRSEMCFGILLLLVLSSFVSVTRANSSVVATTPIGAPPVAVAYGSGKGEVVVVNNYGDDVNVMASAGGSGIPEFPVQPGLILLATAIIVTSCVLSSISSRKPAIP